MELCENKQSVCFRSWLVGFGGCRWFRHFSTSFSLPSDPAPFPGWSLLSFSLRWILGWWSFQCWSFSDNCVGDNYYYKDCCDHDDSEWKCSKTFNEFHFEGSQASCYVRRGAHQLVKKQMNFVLMMRMSLMMPLMMIPTIITRLIITILRGPFIQNCYLHLWWSSSDDEIVTLEYWLSTSSSQI